MSIDYADSLVRLGAITSIDVTRLAPTTLSSILSHVRTLQRNGVEISRDSLGRDPIGTLNSLRDTKGRALSSDYKRQIGMTIKRLYPDLRFNLSQYKVEAYNSETRRANPQYLEVARALLLHAARTLAIIDNTEGSISEQLSVYDTCVAILITSSTSLRIHEIYDLQMSHIAHIRRNEPISLRSKGGKTLRNVVPNELLLRVFAIVERNRDRCIVGVRETRARAAVRSHYADRVRDDYLILSSVDFMRKRLRELAASTGEIATRLGNRSLGFNMFRSFVTTILSEGGGHEIARSLNNHSSVNTTLDHYTVVGPSAAEATYERLEQLMDAVMPIRTADLSESDRRDSQSSSKREELAPKASRRVHPYETPMSQAGDRTYGDLNEAFNQK